MSTEVSKPSSKAVGRIWKWVHLSEINAKKTSLPSSDVVLPDGALFLQEKMSVRDIGDNMVMVSVLPNCDIVYGPTMDKGFTRASDPEEKNLQTTMKKEFSTDMVYLKHAMFAKTIILEDLPRKQQ